MGDWSAQHLPGRSGLRYSCQPGSTSTSQGYRSRRSTHERPPVLADFDISITSLRGSASWRCLGGRGRNRTDPGADSPRTPLPSSRSADSAGSPDSVSWLRDPSRRPLVWRLSWISGRALLLLWRLTRANTRADESGRSRRSQWGTRVEGQGWPFGRRPGRLPQGTLPVLWSSLSIEMADSEFESWTRSQGAVWRGPLATEVCGRNKPTGAWCWAAASWRDKTRGM